MEREEDEEVDVRTFQFLTREPVFCCGVCGLPAEYCEFGPNFNKCKPWLIQHASHLYPNLKLDPPKPKKKKEKIQSPFFPWPEIRQIYQVVPPLRDSDSPPTINYRGKIKLHGTNSAVNISMNKDGKVLVTPQSRNKFIAEEEDHHGFGRWVSETDSFWHNFFAFVSKHHSDYFPLVESDSPSDLQSDFKALVVHGEWFGKGIMKGAAVCELSERSFAIFALRFQWGTPTTSMPTKRQSRFQKRKGPPKEPPKVSQEGKGSSAVSSVLVDPEAILQMLKDSQLSVPPLHVIPYVTPVVPLPMGNPSEMEKAVALMNTWVKDIDLEDPWVRSTFGISGPGEGLVWYPENLPGYIPKGNVHPMDPWAVLLFKTKGASHSVVKTREAVQLSPEVASSAEEFVELTLTPARLLQGLEQVSHGSSIDLTSLGRFVDWIVKDVRKETQMELEMSGLEFSAVEEKLKLKAKNYFLEEARKSVTESGRTVE